MSIGIDVAEGIDSAITGLVLVVGSPPPGGRDLDLLARRTEHDAISHWLGAHDFVERRHLWARFDGRSAEGVELFCTDDWFARSCDSSILFQDVEPIAGFGHLIRPGPAVVLLLAARGIVVRRGHLTEKSRARIARALQRSPDAWRTAERQAPALGLLGALHLLRRSYEADHRAARSARAAGLAATVLGGGTVRAKGKVLLSVRRRKQRPSTVSFSGLDGAGKSTQVDLLQEALGAVGINSTAQWAPFASARRLRPLCAMLDRLSGRPPSAAASLDSPIPDPWLPEGCRDSPLRAQAWVGAVALYNALKQWRHVLRPRPGVDVLLFDRFTPDVSVKLKFHYEYRRHLDVRWQRALFASLSPKPDVGFLLAIPPEVAHNRVHEWDPSELAVMSAAYEEQVGPFQLTRLDGTDQPQELSRRIARTVWEALR